MTRKQRRRIERALAEGLPLTRARIELRHAAPKSPPSWLTTGEVARALKVAPRTPERWSETGRLQADRFHGGRWRINPEDLARFVLMRARRAAR